MVAVLLLAVLFRALIPVGVMPVIGSGGALTLQLCPGTITSPLVATTGQHAHHQPELGGRDAPAHHHHGSGSKGSDQHQLLCPFAASAGFAALPTILAATHTAMDCVVVPASDTAQISLASIVRAQSPRAPPRLG
jgi:hypothetical protein